tara:strand:+ start:261 stop:704 length:444 start_codon:yes stop_codon:yes gene_type:complete
MSYNKYRLEREALENAFARRLLVEYNIKEVTTQIQAKNGTREFEFPVSTYGSKKSQLNSSNYSWDKMNHEPLRIATFKSGYVRKQNGTYSPYQLNKTYKRQERFTFLDQNGKLYTHKGIYVARELIRNQMARMVYMLEYYKRNWFTI